MEKAGVRAVAAIGAVFALVVAPAREATFAYFEATPTALPIAHTVQDFWRVGSHHLLSRDYPEHGTSPFNVLAN